VTIFFNAKLGYVGYVKFIYGSLIINYNHVTIFFIAKLVYVGYVILIAQKIMKFVLNKMTLGSRQSSAVYTHVISTLKTGFYEIIL